MAGERRLLVYWDAEIDGHFRRRFERALAELQIEFADASGVDADPDGPAPSSLAVVSAIGQSSPREADLVVLGGPGDFRTSASALRLEADDIETRSRRWIAFAEKLGLKLNRPGLARFAASDATPEDIANASLAYPADPLAREASVSLRPEVLHEQLAAMKSRAEAAERAAADLERERSDAVRQARQADAQAAVERARAANFEQTAQRLTALSESTAFALASVPSSLRQTVIDAREHAWRARLAAARAAEMAEAHPDALTWPKANATYSGETRNRLPHGFGVIVFHSGKDEVARYAGSFANGLRSGHGVAASEGGHVWHGQWSEGEACGLGLLETPDGRRFEGEVAPGEDSSPRQVRGWTWSGGEMRPARPATHQPVAPALPSPRAAGG